VIIGAAFATIVTSLTEDIIMPIIGAIFGGMDFSNYFLLLSVPEGYAGSRTDYAALRAAGAAMIGYGAFITVLINFLILAFIIFMLVRYAKRVTERFAAAAPAAITQVQLLTEIRDELRRRPVSAGAMPSLTGGSPADLPPGA
jgi:large conductance mechanosensitive channel